MFRQAGLDVPITAQVRLRRSVRRRHRFGPHLRRHRRRDGVGAAHGARTGDRQQAGDHLRARRHHPGARLRRRALRGAHHQRGRPGARPARRTWCPTGIGSRAPRSRWRSPTAPPTPTRSWKTSRPAASSASATSSSSWPARAAAWAAAASPSPPARRSALRGPGPSTARTTTLTVRKSYENPAVLAGLRGVPHRRPVRPQEPRAAAHALHVARQAHRVAGRQPTHTAVGRREAPPHPHPPGAARFGGSRTRETADKAPFHAGLCHIRGSRPTERRTAMLVAAATTASRWMGRTRSR